MGGFPLLIENMIGLHVSFFFFSPCSKITENDTCPYLLVGGSGGGPDPNGDVLRRAVLVDGQHPSTDLQP